MKDKTLNHRERLEKVISGEIPDRIPISFWRHFPVDDQTPEGLAKAVIEYQTLFDFDFIKITPSSSFCLQDWGVKDTWNGNPEGTRDYSAPIIALPGDFTKIYQLNPNKGYLGKQLDCIRIIKGQISGSTPIIQTIFSPLSQIKNLVGKNKLGLFIRLYPDEIKEILKIISATTIQFILECIKLKIDGIFYAVQQAQYNILSKAEFLEFGKSFDLEILSFLNPFWLNLLHIHGSDIMFNDLLDYPVQVINWHDRETRPNLGEARSFTPKVFCGGISQVNTMVLGNKEKIKNEILDSIRLTNSKRFILGTGCVLPVTTPQGNIRIARDLVDIIQRTG